MNSANRVLKAFLVDELIKNLEERFPDKLPNRRPEDLNDYLVLQGQQEVIRNIREQIAARKP